MPPRPPRVVVVGSFNTDLVAFTETLPRPGETVSGARFLIGPGGKGSNQAIAAARLGAEVTFVGRIGSDVFAEPARELWQREAVDSRFVRSDPETPTGVAQILVDAQGENTIVVVLGANLALDESDVDAAESAVAAADVVLTQLEIGLAATRRALELGRRHGAVTILNPAPATPLDRSTLQLVDWLTPNETELETLGAAGDLPLENQRLAVTLGRRGTHLSGCGLDGLCPSFSVRAVDTTGAGDAFNGALAVALGEGRDPESAVLFANAAAATSVTRPGASESMPRRDQVEALLASA